MRRHQRVVGHLHQKTDTQNGKKHTVTPQHKIVSQQSVIKRRTWLSPASTTVRHCVMIARCMHTTAVQHGSNKASRAYVFTGSARAASTTTPTQTANNRPEGASQLSTAQHSTTHSTAQHSTAQHNTAQRYCCISAPCPASSPAARLALMHQPLLRAKPGATAHILISMVCALYSFCDR